MFLVRFDAQCLLSYSTYIGDATTETEQGVVTDGNAIYITGTFTNSLLEMNSEGGFDAVLIKLDQLTSTQTFTHDDSDLNVFPIPVNGDKLNVSVGKKAIEQVQLLDMTGKEIINELVEGKTYAIVKVSEYPVGVYILQVKTSVDPVAHKRIIIER